MVVGVNYIGSTLAIKTIKRTEKLRVPTAITSAQAEADLLRMFANVRGYLATGESHLRDRYHEARQEFEQELAIMIALSANGSSKKNQQRLQELQIKYEAWKILPDRLFVLRDNYLINQPALKLLKDEAEAPISIILRETAISIEEQSERSSNLTNTLLLKDLADFQSSFALLVSSLRGYLVTQEPSFRFEYAAQVQANKKAWQRLNKQPALFTKSQQQHLAKIASHHRTFFAISPEMLAIVKGERSREDLYLLNQEVEPLTAEMLSLLEEIVTSQQEALSNELARGSHNLILAQWQALVAGTIAFLMAIVLGLWLRHKIAAPISRLTEATTSIMHGDFEAQAIVESHDEIGFLANTFNQMIEYLRKFHGDLAQYSHTL
ncbi:MAG: CHASE3 domain-containing protein, partial [Cyanobacteria bacterium J06635_13]